MIALLAAQLPAAAKSRFAAALHELEATVPELNARLSWSAALNRVRLLRRVLINFVHVRFTPILTAFVQLQQMSRWARCGSETLLAGILWSLTPVARPLLGFAESLPYILGA